MRLRDRVLDEIRPVETTAGSVELPIRYWDVSAGIAFFAVEATVAHELVAPTRLRPVAFRGRAIATLNFYDYRGTSIGPYHEVGLTVFSMPGERRRVPAAAHLLLPNHLRAPGFAVLDLPVTTAIAEAGGQEIWGYPKFVTDLPITFDDSSFDGEVQDPDGHRICTLAGTLDRGRPFPMVDLVTYTSHRGQRWRTEITTSGHYRTFAGSGLRLQLGGSDHAMRTRLDRLGLDGASPLMFLVSHDLRSLLHEGSPG